MFPLCEEGHRRIPWLSTSSPAPGLAAPTAPWLHRALADTSQTFAAFPLPTPSSARLIAIRCSGLPTSIPALGVGGLGIGWVRTGRVVDCARRSPHTRANQGTSPGVPRPGTNGSATARTNRGAGQRAAACGHYRQ
jgi:hypothetical protein